MWGTSGPTTGAAAWSAAASADVKPMNCFRYWTRVGRSERELGETRWTVVLLMMVMAVLLVLTVILMVVRSGSCL